MQHDREARFDVVLRHLPVALFQMAQPEADPIFKPDHIGEDNQHFQRSGCNRADGHTLDAKFRKAELSEQQTVIEQEVDRIGHKVVAENDLHLFHAPARSIQGIENTDRDIGKCNGTQVFSADADDIIVAAVYAHDLRCKAQHQRHDHQRENQHEAQRNRNDGLKLFLVPHTPVLRRQHRRAAGKTDHNHADDPGYLIGLRDDRHIHLADSTEHHGAERIDADRQKHLQNQRHHQHRDVAVKALFPNQIKSHCLPLFLIASTSHLLNFGVSTSIATCILGFFPDFCLVSAAVWPAVNVPCHSVSI